MDQQKVKTIVINAQEEPFFSNFTNITKEVEINGGNSRITSVVNGLYQQGVFPPEEPIDDVIRKISHDYCVGYTFGYLINTFYQPLYPDDKINLIVQGELAVLYYK